ncbi:MAG: hypothetical protein GY928_29745 [Colwellia sp.]|nr:hypothetical protein [Colwellia sp.]
MNDPVLAWHKAQLNSLTDSMETARKEGDTARQNFFEHQVHLKYNRIAEIEKINEGEK